MSNQDFAATTENYFLITNVDNGMALFAASWLSFEPGFVVLYDAGDYCAPEAPKAEFIALSTTNILLVNKITAEEAEIVAPLTIGAKLC